jgi:hypothetical protein
MKRKVSGVEWFVDREHKCKILADSSEVADSHLGSLEGRRGRTSPIKQLDIPRYHEWDNFTSGNISWTLNPQYIIFITLDAMSEV